MNTTDRLDAIVIGGGPGGCVAAARLAEHGRRVLLIEAGPGEPRPPSVAGLDSISAAEELSRQWPDDTAKTLPDTSPYRYRQGFGLGGGTLINSLLLSTGDSHDYRRWETEHGCAGWGPDAMAPWLDLAREAFPSCGLTPGPISAGFTEAAAAAGHGVGGSSLDNNRLGVLLAQLASSDGQRVSAADAFLWPKGERGTPDSPNLTILTGRSVHHIVTDGDRAVGVAIEGGEELQAPLIVVGCGAVRTPALLLRSALTKRGVGQRLKDHPSFAFTVSLRKAGIGGGAADRAVSTILRWSSVPDEHGDLQAFVIDRVDDTSSAGRIGPLAVVAVGLMRVTSVGSVTLAPSTGAPYQRQTPNVITGALQTADDRRRLREGVVHVGALLRSPELRPLIEEVLIDDRGTRIEKMDEMSDAELDSWIATHPGPYTHPASSCPLGPADDENAIVSSEPGSLGRLHGYEGIHLVDASVLPDLVCGGLQLPVVAVAERIVADLLAKT